MRASRLRQYAAEQMMPSYDYLSLIKRQAKLRAKTESIKLSAAQAHIALSGGFDHYHELQQVAKKSPNDIRLMRLALHTDDLTEVVYSEDIYSQIDPLLEDELSSQIASTNAEGFYIDELAVEKAEYDQNTGVLSIKADISYTGDQMPDRPYSGTEFNLKAVINLFRQVNQWEFWNNEAFRIISIVSDQDLDWQQQLEAEALKNDPSYQMAEALKNDPSYQMAEALKNDPSYQMAKALKNDPSYQMAEALKNDPSYQMAEALKNDPSYQMAEVLKNDPSVQLAKQMIKSSAYENAIEQLRKMGLT